MVIDEIRKITVKGVKLKSKSFFLVPAGVFELWMKNLKGGGGGQIRPISIYQSRNQSATWAKSVPNGDMVGNGDINFVTPLS